MRRESSRHFRTDKRANTIPILIITLSAVPGEATGYAPRVIEALSNR
ncbi:MAG: hypothetical protein RR058_08105 [Oscillospiraceae bacterium]